MNGRRGRARPVALHPFHDVLLTRGGPPHAPDVIAQHPERRPETIADLQLHAGFNATVLKRLPAGCVHAARRPGAVVIDTLMTRLPPPS
jgi:hypothetical protein